jgi:hypothetical protein
MVLKKWQCRLQILSNNQAHLTRRQSSFYVRQYGCLVKLLVRCSHLYYGVMCFHSKLGENDESI